ncbi:MAG: replicative DNA helicase [Candidatus Pacebacteria bacterium]|nr:replicative DNA helicase [Candidatus Paceibacterota bacterium]
MPQNQNIDKSFNRTQDKLPPQNIPAEKSLLGCLMIDQDAIYKVADFLQIKDFYKPTHQIIFESIIELFTKREPVDLLSVSSKLSEYQKLEETGGASYLTDLINTVPTASNVLHYAKIIQDKRVLRDLISAGYDISNLALQEAESIDILLDKAEKRIFSIAQKSLSQSFTHVKDTLEDTWKRIEELSKQKGSLRGIPTGFRDLDNMLAGLQRSDLVILAARPSLGKCVSKDTEIVMSNPGGVCTIEELVNNQKREVLGLDSNLKVKPQLVSDFINNGVQPVFRVETASGREIETTITHPFLTINGWTPLENIRIGVKVAVPRIIPVFGCQTMSDWKIKCLSYFIAEGGLTNRSPRFTSANPKILQDFAESVKMFPNIKISINKSSTNKNEKNITYQVARANKTPVLAKKVFGEKIKKLARKSNLTQKELAKKTSLCYQSISYFLNGHRLPSKTHFAVILNQLKTTQNERENLTNEYQTLLNENSVTKWLESLGLMGKLATEKFIPREVFHLKKKDLSLFFNHLFACDGSFWQSKKDLKYHLSYASSSKKMIRQIQHLLLRFGIMGTVREKRIKINNKIKIAYELEAHNAQNLLKFIDEIGIYGKEIKLQKAKNEIIKTKIGWTQDTLPIEVWNKIKKLKGNKSWASIYTAMGLPHTHNIHAFKRSPRRETIERLAKALNSQELKDIAQSDIYWDRIVGIKYLGKKQVYDLTVPKIHNFIANDFFVHNSALAVDIAKNVACKYKMPVGIFSLEMSKDQIVDRLISAQADVDLWRLRTGKLSDQGPNNDFERIQKAMAELADAPLYIDDVSSSNVIQMRAMARRLAMDKGLGLLIIDYLQLMEGRGNTDNVVQQVSENSRALKSIAKELNIPVLVLSQLSRAVEHRMPPVPRLSDLRDSGAVEQDADVVMFIYREDRYKPNTERKNVAEIIIAKHRNGPVGKVELYFDETRVTFRDMEKGAYQGADTEEEESII